MMNKKRNTILLFSLCFLILLGLQVFYIYNSYRLEEKEMNRKAREISDDILKEMAKISSETDEEEFVRNIFLLNRETFLTHKEIHHFSRSFQPPEHFNQAVDKLLKEKTQGTGFQMALKNEVFSIYDENQKKELLPALNPIVLYQSTSKVTEGHVISEGKWNSHLSQTDTDKNLDEKYNYILKSKATFQLLNVHSLVIRKIIPLCLVSLSILGFLLYLFWRNLKSIELQNQKIAQLHTTIDSIAHELNTPITTMKFAIASSGPDTSRELMERQLDRLEHIVSSIHTTENKDELIIEKEIEACIQQIKSSYPSLHILDKIHFTKNESLTKQVFESVLKNLVDNSFKYKAKNVLIQLTFGKMIELTVSDDGIGIPETEHAHIFKKYYRVSRVENHEINGLGVGLYLVKKMIGRNKGSIKVISGLVSGVTFKISLPNEK